MHRPFPYYEIRIKESLSPLWLEWFSELELVPIENAGTLLRGRLPDQTSLYSILARLRDLNLTLISVQLFEEDSDHTDH